MNDLLTIAIPAVSLAGSVVALVWARRAIAKAERIRAATESVDRLEMRKIAAEVFDEKTEKSSPASPLMSLEGMTEEFITFLRPQETRVAPATRRVKVLGRVLRGESSAKSEKPAW